jgi:hypothetical protein
MLYVEQITTADLAVVSITLSGKCGEEESVAWHYY